MPKEHANARAPLPASRHHSPPAAALTRASRCLLSLPPVVFMGDSVTMGAFASTPENDFVCAACPQRSRRRAASTPRTTVVWTLNPSSDLGERADARRRSIARYRHRGSRGALGRSFDANAVPRTLRRDARLSGRQRGPDSSSAPSRGSTGSPTTPTLLSRWPSSARLFAKRRRKGAYAVADLWAATDNRPDADLAARAGLLSSFRPCQGDNYHPGDVGHALIAEAYEKALDIALRRAAASRQQTAAISTPISTPWRWQGLFRWLP